MLKYAPFILLVIFAMTSCQKENSPIKDPDTYFSNKSVGQILKNGDQVWISSSMVDVGKSQPMHISSLLMTYQLSVLEEDLFSYVEDVNIRSNISSNGKNELYTVKDAVIVRINAVNDIEVIYTNDTIYMYSVYAINEDSIWFTSAQGLGSLLNGNLTIYNQFDGVGLLWSSSQISADHNGGLYIILSNGRILKIKNNQFETIDLVKDKVLPDNGNVFIRSLYFDQDDNLWMVTDQSGGSLLYKFNGVQWENQHISFENTNYFNAWMDSNGVIWLNAYSYNQELQQYHHQIRYFSNNAWKEYGLVNDINQYIISLNVIENTLYLGCSKGLIQHSFSY